MEIPPSTIDPAPGVALVGALTVAVGAITLQLGLMAAQRTGLALTRDPTEATRT